MTKAFKFSKAINEEDGQDTSQFNEAFLKMHRIHKLQDTINVCSMNPLLFNAELSIYNYEIIVQSCCGLLEEVWSKLDKEDMENALEMRKTILETMRKHPIHEIIYDNTKNKTIPRLNMIHWKVLSEWIFKYKLLIRELIGKTGYDSPSKDDGWDGL